MFPGHIFNTKRCNFPYIMRIAYLWFLTFRLSLILSYILRRYVVASRSLNNGLIIISQGSHSFLISSYTTLHSERYTADVLQTKSQGIS